MQLGSMMKRVLKTLNVYDNMGKPSTRRLWKKRMKRRDHLVETMSQMTRIVFGGRR